MFSDPLLDFNRLYIKFQVFYEFAVRVSVLFQVNFSFVPGQDTSLLTVKYIHVYNEEGWGGEKAPLDSESRWDFATRDSIRNKQRVQLAPHTPFPETQTYTQST